MTVIFKVTVSNQVAEDLTDYTVKVAIDNTQSDFWKYATSPDYIYFLDDSGNPLHFWIEEFDTTNKKATIWVKIPTIPASGSVDIYLYIDQNNPYQNYNDPSKAFYIYDDFNGSSLSSIWNVVKGSPSVSNGYLVLPSGNTSISTSSNLSHLYVKVKCHIDTLPSSADGGLDIIFVKDSSGKYYDAWINYKSGTTQNNADLRYYPGQTPYKWYNGNWTPDTKSHVWEIYRDQKGNMKLLLDGSQKVTAQDTNISSSTEFRLIGFGSDTFNIYIDYVLVRNYVDPEPSVSISFYGAEAEVTTTIYTYDEVPVTITTYQPSTGSSAANYLPLLLLGGMFLLALVMSSNKKE